MSVETLARGHLSTLVQPTEIPPSQAPDNVIYFNSPKGMELSKGLHADLDLQKAGWNSWMEMKRYIDDINFDVTNGITLEQAVSRSTEVFLSHIRYYNAEFIEQEPVLPHTNRFGLWNGETRLLGNNGRPVVDAVDSRERAGSVKRVSQKIEEDLLKADNNSFIVLMSPPGTSGYSDEKGDDMPHLNTLTMVFWKDEQGDVKGVTFVTDLKVDQAEKVMQNLGAPTNLFAKRGTEMQRVVSILENPAIPSLPETYHNPFEYVFDKILAVRGTEDIQLRQKKGEPEIKQVAEIRQKIKNFQSILDLSITKEEYLNQFRGFILSRFQQVSNPDFQQVMIEMAEEAIVRFGGDHLNKKLNLEVSSPVVFPQYTEKAGKITVQHLADDDYRQAIMTFLQSRGGCPTALKALLGRSGSAAGLGESDSMGSLYFPCPACGAMNKRPREGFVNNCQRCGSDKVSCHSSGKKAEKKKEEDYQLPKAA